MSAHGFNKEAIKLIPEKRNLEEDEEKEYSGSSERNDCCPLPRF